MALQVKKGGKFVTKPTVESYISAISFISERNCALGLNEIYLLIKEQWDLRVKI